MAPRVGPNRLILLFISTTFLWKSTAYAVHTVQTAHSGMDAVRHRVRHGWRGTS